MQASIRVRFDHHDGGAPIEFVLAGNPSDSVRDLLLIRMEDPPERTVYQMRVVVEGEPQWMTVDSSLDLATAATLFEDDPVIVDRGGRGGDGFFIPMGVLIGIGKEATQLTRAAIADHAWGNEREAALMWLRVGEGPLPAVLHSFIYKQPRWWESHLVAMLGQPVDVVIRVLRAAGYRHFVADEWWNPDVPESPFNDPRR